MHEKILESFWNLVSKKNKKVKKEPTYDLEKFFISKKANIPNLISLLRNMKGYNEGKYNNFLKYNKTKIEKFVIDTCNLKIEVYEKELENNRNYPTVKELFDIVDINLIFTKDLHDIVINDYLLIQLKNNSNQSPPTAFYETRLMKRKFKIHVGGTNTGKTYTSIQRLKQAKSGAYLGPLRLLALEIQDNLNSSGIPCNLVTGEERDIIENAQHVASTVEMANINTIYDVVVIDECQMIGDRWRGGYWARAIMGMKSKEIHLCTAPEAIDILKKLIESCGDEYEIFNHERVVPLTFIECNGFDLRKDIKPGDALIVFSRKKVLELASELQRNGVSASVIYGALPYNTRKLQMEDFINGKNKVVVATDAIGMGLNLPIKRIVFIETEKFDGEQLRGLLPEEIKQIAGRAGRRGIYNEGFVVAANAQRMIKKALKYTVPQIDKYYLNFPETLLSLNYDIEDILKNWYNSDSNDEFEKQDISVILKLIQLLGKRKFTKYELYALSTIAFDDKNETLIRYWLDCAFQYKKGLDISKPIINKNTLYDMENSYRLLDLYFAFCQKMQKSCDEEWIRSTKENLSNEINKALIKEIKNKPKNKREKKRW